MRFVRIPLLLAAISLAAAAGIDLERPGEREFILDLANLIEPSDGRRIREICDALLTEKATPIIVVTIPSMEAHGGRGMTIETFAYTLFNQWGIGIPELNQREWNTGILLLVSKRDRKARIELGAGWGRRMDGLARRIMDERIISRFKRREFSAGILAGVESLDTMAREKKLPSAPWRPSFWTLVLSGLGVFTVVSMIRRGQSGWAWLLWGVVLTLAFEILTSSGSGGGGSYGGGSFGGGFSGGGGATGSW